MYEETFFPGANLGAWQMSAAERIALAGVLARTKPKGALEVGVYFGGSLSLTSQFAEHVIGIDIDPQVRDRFECPPNAEIWITDSEVGIPAALSHFDRAGIPVNFVLIDGDHSPAGIARDLALILRYVPREPLIMLMHDAGNPGCRGGILSVDWASNPYLHELELDFVIGQIPEHTVKDGRGEIWGGLALAYFHPSPRAGFPIIRQSGATSLRCLRFLANDLQQIRAADPIEGEILLTPGVELRPRNGLMSALYSGWSIPEDWGVWSIGSRATIRIAFRRSAVFPATLLFDLTAFAPPGATQSVAISVGERPEKAVQFDAGTLSRMLPIAIGRGDVSEDLRAEIVFDIENPVSPAQFGISEDERQLGVAVHCLELL
jgi:hypothetical protein